MPQDYHKLVASRMEQLGWTRYQLAKAVRDHLSEPTIYNFLDGKPVKSDTLAYIMEAVGLEVVLVVKGDGVYAAKLKPGSTKRKEAK